MGTMILGKHIATAEQMAKHLLAKNPEPKIGMPVEDFCRLFLYLGAVEGIRGDLEFARSCWETNYFKFTGTVVPEQNNFCGHGTVNSENRGSYFPDVATGILVQIQHAKAYATSVPLNYDCLDDRYKYVKLGSAPTMEEMGGKWAVPGYDTKKYSSLEEANRARDSYGYKIIKIMDEILGKVQEDSPVENEKPLKGIKICLDAGHFGKYNRSPAIPEYYESDMAWDLHLLQKKYLEELGATVIVTRSSKNTDKALKDRGLMSIGCDLVLSDHSNAVGGGMDESIDYVAVYHLVDDFGVICDDISKEIAKELAPVISRTMGVSQGYKVLTRKSGNDRNGDGVMNDNYYGFLNGARLAGTPGLILEHSFHTNSKSVQWLLNKDNLDRLARAEAEAIANYFKKEKSGTSEVEVPFMFRVANVEEGDVLYIREEPNAKAAKTGLLAHNDPMKYTIVEVQGNWGRLKSGVGWVNLKYTERV